MLMIILDSRIVNVALPSIKADLGFSQSALAWVAPDLLRQRPEHPAPTDDGLVLVQVTDGAAPRPFAEALGALDAEIDERERVLRSSERRVFGDAIVEELAEHLRRRIHEVRYADAQLLVRGCQVAGLG
jgi:nucleotide-binding universal stress UspA family protein